MEILTYDTTGKQQSSVVVDDDTFGVNVNRKLLSQYVHVHHKNVAIGTRKTKDRGEVSGGGRKPWRQKGTGRARHGSIRSPLWVGGGHTHAILPTPDSRFSMPKKMREKALSSALSWHAKQGSIIAVAPFELEKPRTKDIMNFLIGRGLVGTSVLFVTHERSDVFVKSTANIASVDVMPVSQLNAYEVLSHGVIVFVGDAYAQV